MLIIQSAYADPLKCHYEEQTTINVVFDTGSTNLWIASDLCTTAPCINSDRHRYGHTYSETYQVAGGGKLDIEFGTGELQGEQAIDHLHVGPFTVRDQTFGMIESEIGDAFRSIPFEGILGLAFPSMSANKVTPFFDNARTTSPVPRYINSVFYKVQHKYTQYNTIRGILNTEEENPDEES